MTSVNVPEMEGIQTRPGPMSFVSRLLDREDSLGIVLMLPAVLLLMIFLAYPFVLGIWLSLTDSTVAGMGRFVGLRNFVDLLSDTIFLQSVRNTFIYATVTVPFKAVLGLGLALVLNRPIRFSSQLRAAVMMPWIVPTALSSLAWLMILDPVFSPISWLLKSMGIIGRDINFLGSPVLAISSICIVNIWRGIPFFGITLLAGLQAVPQELYEAAAMDGATSKGQFLHVTLPGIKGVATITSLLSIIWTFSDFQMIYVITKGGPANATHVFGTYAYQIGLGATQIGMGAAISLSIFPILAVVSVLLLFSLRREV